MKIYVCTPETVFRHENFTLFRNEICLGFRVRLRKFYSWFKLFNIEFHEGRPYSVDVYVMGDAVSSSFETTEKIINVIRICVHDALGFIGCTGIEINVRLSWKYFEPNFHPEILRSELHVQEQSAPLEQENNYQPQNLKDRDEDLREFDYGHLAKNFQAEKPLYSFERVMLPDSVMTKIKEALAVIQVEAKVFDEWGLRNIMPFATCAMSFYGPSGTGKSMAAEAVADYLDKKIIRAGYADITSKYKGQGQKMVKALFLAAEKQNAVLFIDESESLLAKRSADSDSASVESSNAMKSQLLILLEQYNGIVIFATNLPKINDNAFNSRLISIKFTLPDQKAREKIWEQHIMGKDIKIPLSDDVNLQELAEKYEFCGRDIKKAVRDACVTSALNSHIVSQEDFIRACDKIKAETEELSRSEDYTTSQKEVPQFSEDLKNVISEKFLNNPSEEINSISL